MKLMKRISATLSANVNSAVSQLENHEAIVAAAIKQTRQSIAKTQAQYNALNRQQKNLTQKLNSAQSNAALWAERAARAANEDKDKALACLSRRNQYEHEQAQIKAALQQQQDLLREISQHLESLNARLHETQQRHQQMRSRQSLAKTTQTVAACLVEDDIETTFERWEATVLEQEPGLYDLSMVDSLELELSQAESRVELEAQLAELLKQDSAEVDNDSDE